MPGIADATGVQWRGGDFTDHVLTDWYQNLIVDALNSVTKWYDMITTSSEHIDAGGKFVRWLNRTGRNFGTNAMDARGKLPDPMSQQWKTSFNHMKDYYGRIKIDGKTKRQSARNPGAYIDAVDSEMRYIIEDAQVDWQRMVLNDGSGRLAETTGTPAGGTVDLAIHGGVSRNGTIGGYEITANMGVGMRLLFVEPDGTNPAVKYITSITDLNTIVVADTPGGTPDSTGVTGSATPMWVVRVSRDTTTDLNDSAFRAEFMGLEGFFDDRGVLDGNGLGQPDGGTNEVGSYGEYDIAETNQANAGFQGCPADADHEWNRAILLDNAGGGGRNVTDALMNLALSDAERINNSNVNLVLMSYGAYVNYVSDLFSDKRYVNTQELQGGGKVMDFNGIPLHKEKDMYGGRAYFIDTSQFAMQEVAPLEWLDTDGSIWSRVTDEDAWEAAFVKTCQFMCYTRQRIGAALLELNEGIPA